MLKKMLNLFVIASIASFACYADPETNNGNQDEQQRLVRCPCEDDSEDDRV